MKDEEFIVGDLRVCHMPQVPGPVFFTPVLTVQDALWLMEILARYDIFQYEHRIKPDYANTSWVEIMTEDGWEDAEVGDYG